MFVGSLMISYPTARGRFSFHRLSPSAPGLASTPVKSTVPPSNVGTPAASGNSGLPNLEVSPPSTDTQSNFSFNPFGHYQSSNVSSDAAAAASGGAAAGFCLGVAASIPAPNAGSRVADI